MHPFLNKDNYPTECDSVSSSPKSTKSQPVGIEFKLIRELAACETGIKYHEKQIEEYKLHIARLKKAQATLKKNPELAIIADIIKG